MPELSPKKPSSGWSAFRQYGLALLSVVVATGVRWLLDIYLQDTSSYITYFLSNVIVMRYARRGPSLLAIGLSTVAADYFFIPPRYTLTSDLHHYFAGLVFLTANLVVLALSHALRGAKEVAEANSQAAREKAALLDLAPVLGKSLDGTIRLWGRGAERLYGYAEAEALGRKSHELLQTHFPQPMEQIIQNVLNSGEWKGELVRRRKDGTLVTVLSQWILQPDAQGHPAVILETDRDITERKQAEETIRHQNAVLEGINELFHRALFCQSEEELGRICLAVAERITGSQFGFLGEINPKTGLLDDIAISDSGWEACRMEHPSGHGNKLPSGLAIHGLYSRVLKTGEGFFTNQPVSHPDRIGTPQGHPPLTAFLGVPLLQDGKAIGMIVMANREGGYRPADVETLASLASAFVQVLMRRRAEEALKKAHDELELRVQERTAQLNKALANLRDERQRFQDVLNALPVYVALLNSDHHVTFANRVFQERFGVSNGKRCFEHLFGRTEPCEVCETYKVFQENRPQLWEWTGPDQRNYSVFDFPFSDTDGSPLILEMGIDVTQRKQAEAELQKYRQELESLVRRRTAQLEASNEQLRAEIMERKRTEAALRCTEERFRRLVEVSAQIVWVTNAWGEPEEDSPSWRAFTGRSYEQWVGSNWLEVIHPKDREHLAKMWHQAVTSRHTYEVEFRMANAAGEYRHMVSRAVPLFDADGTIREWIGMSTDITERKRMLEALTQAKEHLRHYADNLERVVAERTAKLQEMVAELEHFSFTITHDLRSPLRAMRGFSEVLLEEGCADCPNGMSKELLKRIHVGAQRMDLLITDALDYSRAVLKALPLQPVDIGALLRGLLQTYPNLQPVYADIVLEGEFPLVVGNEAALVQCCSNLLGNAVKFVAAGSKPRVRIWAESRGQTAGAEDSVRLWFEDNGIGIAKEHQDKLFQMFYRISKAYEGTGIGLALVRKNMERMGGRVGVESEPGQGCRFWLELKLALPGARERAG